MATNTHGRTTVDSRRAAAERKAAKAKADARNARRRAARASTAPPRETVGSSTRPLTPAELQARGPDGRLIDRPRRGPDGRLIGA